MVSVQVQQEFAYIGQNISLHCTTESYPLAIHFWKLSNGSAISSGKKSFRSLEPDQVYSYVELCELELVHVCIINYLYKGFHIAGNRHHVRQQVNNYITKVTLRIIDVRKEDFGVYYCVAKNSLGQSDGPVKLSGTTFLATLNPEP